MAAQIPISSFLLPLFLIQIAFSPELTFASSLSFNFTSFVPGDTRINYQRAFSSHQAIELTGEAANNNANLVGRATYSEPLHLWDKASGNLSRFETRFSFAINSSGRALYGDGLTFFFAPNGSAFDPDITKGGALGIGSDPKLEINSSFFAVEFDIFKNYYDPPGEHVGIDINSMVSVANTTWMCDIKRGKRTDVSITYDSITHDLSVAFTGFQNDITVLQQLHHVVDLRQNLPEWVTFGFSAATGSLYATHTIYSWDFQSTLNLKSDTDGVSSGLLERSKNKISLIIGLGAGLGSAILVGGLLITWIVFWRKKKKMMMMKEEEKQSMS